MMAIRSSQEHWTSYTRRLALALAIIVVGAWPIAAVAQSAAPRKPSGSVNIHQVQVAFIGSGTAGGGTLYHRGRSYSFKLGGLGIGGIGVSTLDATGGVYNLRRLQDFDGVYSQAEVGWAVGEAGKGDSGRKMRMGCSCV